MNGQRQPWPRMGGLSQVRKPPVTRVRGPSAAREEAEQKIALELARIEAHNRLEARKLRRRASSKKKIAGQVVPVETVKKADEKKADKEDFGDV